MSPSETPQEVISGKNYELLIRIDEQLKNLTSEVRNNNTDTTKRIGVLEEVKLAKSEFTTLFISMDTLLKDHEKRIKIAEDNDLVLKTQIKTWGWLLAIIFTLGQFILKFIKIN